MLLCLPKLGRVNCRRHDSLFPDLNRYLLRTSRVSYVTTENYQIQEIQCHLTLLSGLVCRLTDLGSRPSRVLCSSPVRRRFHPSRAALSCCSSSASFNLEHSLGSSLAFATWTFLQGSAWSLHLGLFDISSRWRSACAFLVRTPCTWYGLFISSRQEAGGAVRPITDADLEHAIKVVSFFLWVSLRHLFSLCR